MFDFAGPYQVSTEIRRSGIWLVASCAPLKLGNAHQFTSPVKQTGAIISVAAALFTVSSRG